MRSRLWADQRGVALIEVVITVAILSVLIIPLLGALSNAVLLGRRTDDDNAAVALARSQMEFIKQESYVEPPDYATLTPPEGFEIEASGETLVPSFLQQVTVRVLYGEDQSFTLEGYKVNRVPGVAPPPGP